MANTSDDDDDVTFTCHFKVVTYAYFYFAKVTNLLLITMKTATM